jgi:hypothetical protein
MMRFIRIMNEEGFDCFPPSQNEKHHMCAFSLHMTQSEKNKHGKSDERTCTAIVKELVITTSSLHRFPFSFALVVTHELQVVRTSI